MAETIAVGFIVGFVMMLAIKSVYRTFQGKNNHCGCGTGTCPASASCNQRTSLSEKEDERE